jgi:hypothetical protein
MASSCPPILVPEQMPCSERGTCISETLCSCPEGWTGAGDYVFGEPTCAIHIVTVKALWGIAICLEFLGLLLTLRFMQTHRPQPDVGGKRNANKVALFMYFVVSMVVHTCSWIITGILRVTRDPKATIGTDPAITIIYAIGTLAFWLFTQAFMLRFLEVQREQARVMNPTRKFARMRLYFVVTESLLIASVLFPLIQLSGTDARTVENLITCHYFFMAVGTLFIGLVVIPQLIGTTVKDIEQLVRMSSSDRSASFAPVLRRLERFQTIVGTLALGNSALMFCFAFWPFLQIAGSSYWLPIVTISDFIVQVNMFTSLRHASRTKPSIGVVASSGQIL